MLAFVIPCGVRRLCSRPASFMVLPENVTPAEAAVTEPLSCAYNGFSKCFVKPGEYAMVVGAGPIGFCHAMLLHMGAIGKRLAVRARAFEMNVLAYDPYFDEAFAKENEIARTGLDELFRLSDVISLHLPLNDETRHLVDAGRIREMRDGAILINAARGGLIDEQAAAEALKAGKLGGLGLDAFEQEPLLDSPLKGLPHVVFTPHTGAHTGEAVANMAIVGFIWKFIFSQGFSSLYDLFGWKWLNYSWLGSPKLVYFSVVLVGVWYSLGFYVVLYIAGLKSIPNDVLEASEIDGAGAARRFFSIKLPLLMPSVCTCTLLSVTSGLQVFDVIMAPNGADKASARSATSAHSACRPPNC